VVTFTKQGGGLHQRRGISTIVGAAIFLILFASATSTFFIALEAQRDTVNSQRAISDVIIDKTKEKFSIAPSVDESNGNLLGIHVKNLGTNPVEIDDIWIVNKSGSFPAKKHLIDYRDSVIPPGYGSNILENTPLTMLPDDYDIKVVSTFGTIEKSEFNVGGNNYLRATLLAIPPDVKINKNVTLTMHVENIGSVKLLNVKPFYNVPNISTPLDPPIPPTPTPVDLDPGESVFFTWQYTVKAGGLVAGNKVTFDNYAEATIDGMPPVTVKSNDVKESIKLLEPDSSDIIVLTQDLLSRPEIFMIIPSPFGIDNQEGLWGVNVVNPTPIPFEVSKVTISANVPRSQSTDRIFDTNKCTPTTVAPTPANWDCPSDNQLMWENQAVPVTVPPYSVFPFLVTMDPGSLGGASDDLEAVLMQVTVHTTLGQFGKAGYGSSIKNAASYANVGVYLSEVAGSTSPADIRTTVTGITSGSKITLHPTLADFDLSSSNYIDAGSRLIINVPKGWTVDASSINTGDFTCVLPCPQVFSDTSSQISGTLNANLNGASGVAESIQFDVTAPLVTTEQMYVMYLLAEGSVNGDDFAIGPLAEIVLQVVP
jgi:archaellum component FlaF (FlaF/FlaG flagellin family)